MKNLEIYSDVTIQGHTTLDAYSYFYVAFYPCVNGKRGRNNCADSDTVKMHLTQTALMVKMEDIELTPQLFKTPVQVRTRELTAPVMDSLYNNIQAYFHIIEIQTDNDILGFEAFSIKKKEKHFKYDVTFMVNSINSELPTNSGEAYCNIQLQLTEQMISIDRTYTKLIEVLGDVGGLMEFVFSFFKLISIFITEALYEKGIVNHLFSFDIDKKVIELKNSNKNILLNKAKTFKSLKHDYKLSSNILVYSNENTTKAKSIMKEGGTTSENKLNSDNILSPKSTSLLKVKNKRKIKKKKLVRINTMKSENEDIKSKQILKNNLKDDNEIKNSNFGEHIIETEKVSRRKISKLTFTKVDLYVCFLCTRKRKKIQNILIDEGMNMFSEKLDVINIFTKLMKIEDFENLAHKEKAIEMSDECKKRLQDFNYPKNLD